MKIRFASMVLGIWGLAACGPMHEDSLDKASAEQPVEQSVSKASPGGSGFQVNTSDTWVDTTDNKLPQRMYQAQNLPNDFVKQDTQMVHVNVEIYKTLSSADSALAEPASDISLLYKKSVRMFSGTRKKLDFKKTANIDARTATPEDFVADLITDLMLKLEALVVRGDQIILSYELELMYIDNDSVPRDERIKSVISNVSLSGYSVVKAGETTSAHSSKASDNRKTSTEIMIFLTPNIIPH